MQEIVEAIINMKKIKFYYDGKKRIVDPHMIGKNKKNNIILSGFQTGGETSSELGWKTYSCEKIEDIEILKEKFEIATGYNPDGKNMIEIIKRIEK